MKRYGRCRADFWRFALRERPSAFFFLGGISFALSLLVSGSSFLRGLVRGNLAASLETFPENAAVAFSLPEKEEEFFDAPLMKEAKEEGMRAETLHTTSCRAVFPESPAGHTHTLTFAPSAEELKVVYGVSCPETFDGVLLSSAYYASLPPEKKIGSIRFFEGETTFAEVKICGTYSLPSTPSFLSPILPHPLEEDRLFVPSSFLEAFKRAEEPLRWGKSAVLHFPAPLSHDRSLLLSSAFSRNEISTRALVYETELGKLEATLFAYFDATDALFAAAALLLIGKASLSFFSRKQKERAIRLYCGMGTAKSLLYGFFACLLAFLFGTALCALFQAGLSLALYPYLHGRVVLSLASPDSGFYFAFLAFSCAIFLLSSAFTHRSAYASDAS